MPTIEEYTLLSLAANNDIEPPIGWNRNTSLDKYCYNHISGFEASVLEHLNNDGTKIVVISFKYNDLLLNDAFLYIQSALGTIPQQQKDAQALYNAVIDYYKDQNIEIQFTGFSLGGTIAQLMGSEHQECKTITFAAPGVSHFPNIDTELYYNNITNYTSINDPVGNLYNSIGKTYLYYPMNIDNISITKAHSNFIEDYNLLYGDIDIYAIEKPINFTSRNSMALVKFDNDFDMSKNIDIETIPPFSILYSIASEEDLKDSIDIINNGFFIKSRKLHYVTSSYSYIIGRTINDNGSDELIGIENKKNIIWGNGGIDCIKGMSSDDLIIGDYTTYNVRELERILYMPNLIDGSKFTDTRYSNEGNDELYGGSGNDVLIGCGGNDYLNGGKDNDYLYGGSGDDILVGGEGKDVLYGGNNDDILIAGDTSLSNDSLKNLQLIKDNIETDAYTSKEGKGSELYGEEGNDLLIGDKGDDYLDGGGDNDYLYGGSGDDTLIGGIGDDRLYGGQGYDTYIINSGDGCDTIDDSDKQGCVQYNGNQLSGAHSEDPHATYWIDRNGNTYSWSYNPGTTLIINGTTTVLNFSNGNLGITLTRGEEEEEEQEPTIDPTNPEEENPKDTPLPGKKEEQLPDIMPTIKNATKSAGKPGDPIILDLDNNGVKITDTKNGVYFDFDNDGFKEAAAWVDKNDGILVVDKNNNGIIDDGSELLVHNSLVAYDSNNDGKIDSNDENVNQIKILKGDGTLLTLDEAGIEFISLNTQNIRQFYDDDSEMFARGTFTKTNGNVQEYGEFNLATNTFNSLETGNIEVSEDVKNLPYIKNIGKANSLWQAIMKDETGVLKELVESFVSETNDEARMNLVDQILEKWANATDVENGSRGEFVDAKKLAIIETFMGIDFYSENEGEETPQNPNQEAGQYLITAYEQLKTYIYAELMSKTHQLELFNLLEVVPNEEGKLKFDLTNVISTLKAKMETNPEGAKQDIYEFSKILKGYGYDTKSNFFDPKDDTCFYTTFTKDDRELKWLIDTISKIPYVDERGENEGTSADDSYRMESQDYIHALRGDDVAYGSDEDDSFAMCSGDDLVDAGDGNDVIDTQGGNDIIFAGAGDDVIHASDGDDIIFGGDGDDLIYPDHGDDFSWAEDGNDIIRGGKGNDTIYSMVGDDTFIFYRGDGQDVVYEHQGIDTFYFGPDITWEDLIFEQSDNDMIIKIKDTDDQITVKDWFLADEDDIYRYNNHKIEIFEFADGSKHYKDEITVGDNTESVTYNMNEHEDYVELASDYKTTVNLSEGWNHVVAGRNSDDTYVLNTEQTDVLIQDYDGSNTIKFGEGIQLAQTFFAYDENGLEIWFEYFDAHMQIQGDIDTFKFEFADGSVLTDVSSLLQRDISYTDYIMGENLEELRLLGNDSLTVIDNNRDSKIITNNGDTTIDFGQGYTIAESKNGGNNVYIYNLGDSEKYIEDFGGADTIKFGEGITTENIHFLKDTQDNNLEIWFDIDNENNDHITIESFFGDDNHKIEYFEFADGSVIDDVEEYIRAWGSRNDEDLELPDNIQEAHLRGEGHISATGNDLDNWIGGNFGDNTFTGGKGNDSFWDDQGGADKFIYNLGDGHDNIDNFGGLDTIIFGEGITLENTIFTRDENGHLIINFANNEEDSIFIGDYFNDDNRKIELFKFSDGTTLSDIEEYINNGTMNTNNIVMEEGATIAQLQYTGDGIVVGNASDNIIIGNMGNNSYHGGGGNDTIIDMMGGNDTYYYNINNGHDEITDNGGYDKIKFGQDINIDDLDFEMNNNDLVISFNNGREGSLVIKNYFASDNSKVECFEFNDGTVVEDITDRLITISADNNYEITEDSQIVNVVMSGTGNITVTGDSRDNVIVGNSGNNTFEGKGGNDYLIDTQGGNDTYIYNLGDGEDTIYDLKGSDTIKFGEGITLENLGFMQTETDLNIWFMGIEGQGLCIRDFFSNTDNKIEKFELSDGTVITDISNLIRAIGSDKHIVLPDGIQQAHSWGEDDISIIGNDMDNWIGGNAGNNTITGGKGNDYLNDDQGGDDTYIYNVGDGYDTINDFSGYDRIKFGYGITKENMVFIYNDGHLVIQFKDNDGNIMDGHIRVEDYFNDDNKRIEALEFADGSIITDIDSKISVLSGENNIINYWNLPEIQVWTDNDVSVRGAYTNETIYGGNGNNTYDLQGGTDIINAGSGNDTYIYNHDYENKFIVDMGGDDVIKFGSGIDLENTRFVRNNNNLRIYFLNNGNGFIQIEDYFVNDNRKIERFEFSDGTVITEVTNELISGKASYGDIYLNENENSAYLLGEADIYVEGNDNEENFIYGNSGNNTYNGRGGHDHIESKQGGNDTYIYNIGDGNDYIVDIGGDDVVKFGDGITLQDVRFTHKRNDLLVFVDIGEEGGCIQIENYFKSDLRKIERFEFTDGTVITDVTDLISGIDIDSDYTFDEDTQITEVYMKGKEDLSVTGNSKDTHIEGNEGNNTYNLKGGNDYVYDPDGDDTYIYNLGDGWDTIRDFGGYDTVKFGEGLNVSDMKVMNRNGNGIEIWFDGVDGNLVIEDCLENNECRIERFEFADGTIIENIENYMNCIASESDIELPDGYKEAHLWGENDISATGNDDDNNLNGNSGNNRFEGKKGNDSYWDNQGGDDTFVYNLGDGYDNIANIGGYDTIQFGEGITQNMLRMDRCDNGDLEIFIDADTEENCGSIRIQNYFYDDEWKIEKVILADGTEITDFSEFFTFVETDSDYTIPENGNIKDVVIVGENDVNVTGNSQDNYIEGNFANNTYNLKGGDDSIYDPNGDDTYIYNLGDGNDHINDDNGDDTVILGEGITRDMVSFMQDDYNNMHIRVNGEQYGEILVEGQYHDNSQGIEKVQFADGTVLTDINSITTEIGTEFNNIVLPEGYLQAHLWGEQNLNATGNNLDNFMRGNAGDNVLEGKGGNDYYWELEGGNDTYIYNIGDGWDYINDVGGNDTIQFGSGITTDNISFAHDSDNYLNLSITFDGIDGGITIENYFAENNQEIESFKFADGSVLTDISSYLNNSAGDIDPVDPTMPDEPIDEEEPVLPLSDGSDFDVNLLIQEINAYGTDSDVVMTEIQNPNNDELILAMVS